MKTFIGCDHKRKLITYLVTGAPISPNVDVEFPPNAIEQIAIY